MTGLMHWFAMNGYASYVWPAYGVVFFVLLINVWSVKRQRVRTRNLLRQWFKTS